MWKFWAILGAALLGGGVYVVAQSRPAGKQVVKETAPAEPVRPSRPDVINQAPEVKPVPPARPSTPEPARNGTPAQPLEPEASATDAPPEAAPVEPTSEENKKPGEFDELVPTEPAPEITPPPIVPEAPAADAAKEEPAPENLKKLGAFSIVPGKIERKDDGSLLLDGKYTLKGEGTPQSPYVVSWDLLTSAEEAFDPQNGKRRLPERVAMLDGKTVRLNGYIAFPMTSTEPRELLSMLNQWDGCCIGTPPTPYDAVEVALTETVEGDDRFATTGKVVGTFHVKPYLEGDWLIGLYVMEDAKLTPRDFGPGAN
ncbi:MAG TPA: DUF3299 domain-containing protein [Phycisphaerales bacterium]|nr:DUF3299 domain-containing protein [Phycisphaerales bacterium]